jgi:serine protease
MMQGARKALGLRPLMPNQIMAILAATANRPVVRPNRNETIGAGILDAEAAVEAAVGGRGLSPLGR